ncbi:MAG: hypothetical protein JWQ78_1855 [Sediminibacterium sp.]|nr:hypothetical protein [Sediminibacterium sp.]
MFSFLPCIARFTQALNVICVKLTGRPQNCVAAIIESICQLTDMKVLSFFSRFAFICNLLFLVCLVVQRTHDFIGSKEVSGVVITLGWFVAPFLNLAVCLWYSARLVSRKPLNLPNWLVLMNFGFLLLQFFIHYILPS